MTRATRVIETEAGAVRGTVDARGVARWLGLPYAAPPVGPLRWRAPQPALPWAGVREALRFGDACPQAHVADDALMRQFSFAQPQPECGESEDCLTLNVWAPADAGPPLPVIVFVYGGGHQHGAGSHPVSQGAHLAAAGAVVVTFNYRVGALGYLAHPALSAESGASGHWAVLDVVAALQWVQRNIAAFGGDPARVALFGQSAGAALANVLMAVPLAAGLFQRAMVHSSGRLRGAAPMGVPMKTLQQAEQEGLAWAAGARTAAELRALDSLQLPSARGQWGPIVDGHALREPVDEVFRRGAQHAVPLLAGYTHDDASGFPTPALHTEQALREHLAQQFGPAADALARHYQLHDDASAVAAAYALRRDAVFAYQPWRLARLHAARTAQPVHLFEFMQAPPVPAGTRWREPPPPGGYGAYHGSELWYVFGNFDVLPWAWSEADRRLSADMAAAWVAFAASGQPGAVAGTAWPAFDEDGACLRLAHRCASGLPTNDAALRLIEGCFA